MTLRCATCAHYQSRRRLVPADLGSDERIEVDAAFGLCRRYPATPTFFGSRFPTVGFDDVCGEFSLRTPTHHTGEAS